MLTSYELVGAAPGPHLLVVGGVHGDEYEPMVACRRLRDELDLTRLRGRVTIVPCVNEPAFRRGARTADDGKDLARTCPGRADGTITERLADALSELIRRADYFVDLHTGGVQYRLLPLAGYVLHADPRVLDVQRRMARAFNLPVVWGTSPELQGRSLSVARDAGVPAIYAEYEGGAQCSEAGVQAYVDGCRGVLCELEMLAEKSPPPAPRIRYEVEDPRPQSGHLQINHPAPLTGIFEPAVRLEQDVRAGDVLGTIRDCAGRNEATIRAARSGIVLMLPALPRVVEGDATSVVLEVEPKPTPTTRAGADRP